MFEEADEGNLWFSIVNTDAVNNGNDGYEIEEADEGSLLGNVFNNTSVGNDGKGFDLNEDGDGDPFIKFLKTTTDNGQEGDKNDGIEADQEDAGQGTIVIRGSDIVGGTDLDGVDEL